MPSTVIRSFTYHAAQNQLEITFQSGRRYVYERVPPEIYEAMKKAFSKGEFFNEHIRDRFTFTREG
jgi:KTSC domain-containing protein